MARRSRSFASSICVTSGSPLTAPDRPNAHAEETRHVGLVVSHVTEYLKGVPREHVDHPFPRCLMQRVCDPKGPAQSGPPKVLTG
jgi:hypothetical protein